MFDAYHDMSKYTFFITYLAQVFEVMYIVHFFQSEYYSNLTQKRKARVIRKKILEKQINPF